MGHDALCSDPVQLPNYSLPRPDDPLSGSGVFFESGIPEDDFEVRKNEEYVSERSYLLYILSRR